MDYTVTVNEDDVSEIVRLSLEEMLSINLLNGDDSEYTTALVAAMIVVHQYYSTHAQHNELLKEYDEELSRYNSYIQDWVHDNVDVNEKSGVDNITVVDEEDGSATISFDADPATLNVLASKGVEYSIVQSIIGSASTSDILRWAEIGRESELTR